MGPSEGGGFPKRIPWGRGVMTHSGDVPGQDCGGHGAPRGHPEPWKRHDPGAVPAAQRWPGQVPRGPSGLVREEERDTRTQNRRIICKFTVFLLITKWDCIFFVDICHFGACQFACAIQSVSPFRK